MHWRGPHQPTQRKQGHGDIRDGGEDQMESNGARRGRGGGVVLQGNLQHPLPRHGRRHRRIRDQRQVQQGQRRDHPRQHLWEEAGVAEGACDDCGDNQDAPARGRGGAEDPQGRVQHPLPGRCCRPSGRPRRSQARGRCRPQARGLLVLVLVRQQCRRHHNQGTVHGPRQGGVRVLHRAPAGDGLHAEQVRDEHDPRVEDQPV
mmetsp:Transcript_42333/g.102177  ORF Transcript_42333/g.102177 Transcript_42333/m.102177 type:complete len:203 (+) Transcript_42333:285-893(+)